MSDDPNQYRIYVGTMAYEPKVITWSEEDTDRTVLENLDFETPCEDPHHGSARQPVDAPAEWAVWAYDTCKAHGDQRPRTLIACTPCLEDRSASGWRFMGHAYGAPPCPGFTVILHIEKLKP